MASKAASPPDEPAKPGKAPPAPASAPAPAPEAAPLRRANDAAPAEPDRRSKSKITAPRRATPSRTENVVAAFLFAVILGCAGIWLEHNRCPGALRMAAVASAPLAIAGAVPVAGLLALLDRKTRRKQRIFRGVMFTFWAGAASTSLSTAFLLAANERGEIETITRGCLVTRRETVPAPDAGVRDWILVLRCSDAMSLVRIDVDREKWWEHEPGAVVDADLRRGQLGYEWVVDVPSLGPPIRHIP